MTGKKIFVLMLIMGFAFVAFAQKPNQKKEFDKATQQIKILLNEAKQKRNGKLIFPRSLEHDSLRLVSSGDWTSGFFPGILWLLYEYTADKEWKKTAEEYTTLMSKEQYNRSSHDVGFKIYTSYGNAYRLTNDSAYKKIIIQSAKTLATRFNPKAGVIKSWDFPQWQYPVIIDNMMNLELLFEATKLSHDSTYYKIAVSHANTTMKNHFRSDYSSYHVVDYDTITGKVISRTTHQGYSNESSWARGQAWALYGYTMCYRETKNKTYLEQAEHVAGYILHHPSIPADGIPYWDYSVPNLQNEPRDVSAAAVTASALYELSGYVENGKNYRKSADKIMSSLANYYSAPLQSSHGFILLHSTGNKPDNGEVDMPIIYADYYYLEALLRSGKK